MPRSTKRSEQAAQAALDARFERSELWNGFVRGQPVRVTGVRGGHWRFRCHVVHLIAGTSWVEVDELDVPRGMASAGTGSAARFEPGEDARQPAVRRIRAFEEDRVVALPRPRRRRSDAGTSDRPPPAGRPPGERHPVAARAGATGTAGGPPCQLSLDALLDDAAT